jgi:anti-sigma factor RsiW
MECGKIREMLAASFEGELTPQEAAELQRHLEACPECRREKALHSEAMGMLDVYAVPEVSQGFTASLLGKIRSGRQPAKPRSRTGIFMRRALVSGIAACLVLFAGWAAYQHFSDDDRVTSDPVPVAGYTIPDEDIIRDLEVYENLDLLENFELLDDLDVLQEMDESALPGGTT